MPAPLSTVDFSSNRFVIVTARVAAWIATATAVVIASAENITVTAKYNKCHYYHNPYPTV